MAAQPDRILDAWLVVSARAGDRRAFARLVLRWNRKLRAHAWRLLRDDEAAKDAVQDGWAEIVRGLDRLRDPDAFAPWAYRIVSRRCARQIRRAQGRRRIEAEMALEPPAEPPAPGAALDRERVRAALAALPPAQQAAVALYHLEEMSVAEVAVALDCPAGTIKTRLMHARRKLRALFEGDE